MSDSTRRTVRTVLQTILALAAVLPVLLPELGVSTTAGVGALVLAVAGVVTRITSEPSLQRRLPGWLRTEASAGSRQSLTLDLGGADPELLEVLRRMLPGRGGDG